MSRWSLYRNMLFHTATYAVATAAHSLATVLLFPVYTRYLSTTEYGVVAILDLTTQLLIIVLGGRLTAAAFRFSSDACSREDHARVWATAYFYAAGVGVAALIVGSATSPALARLTLGSERYAHSYRIIFCTFLATMISSVPSSYLVATKRSTLSAVVSLARLFVGVGLSTLFIVILGWGIDGFLYAGLITGTLFAALTSTYMLRHTGWHFSAPLLKDMLRFSAPLVPSALFFALMHEGDRFILQRYVGVAEVGIYSVGYKVAMMTSLLMLMPFSAAWNAILYDVNRRDDARQTYARIMSLFTCVMALVMVTVSLFAREIVELLTGPEFHPAYRVVPLVSLAYVFYSMLEHFSVPSLLTRRTGISVIVSGAGAASNLLLNLMLIPSWGYMGAAVATTVSFAICSAAGLLCYRRLYAIPYALGKLTFLLLSSLPCFAAGMLLGTLDMWLSLATRTTALVAFAIVVLCIAWSTELAPAGREVEPQRAVC